MNILCLYGSPRPKGNSAVLANAFCDAAEREGATVRRVLLNKLDYKGCQSCFACKKTHDHCVLEDGLADVLEAARQADCLALATPVYYGDVTAQLKGFIDRTFSFLVPDYAKRRTGKSRVSGGRHFVLMIAQGHPLEERFEDIYPRYSRLFGWMGYDRPTLLRACGVYHPGDMEKRVDMLEQAAAVARRIAQQPVVPSSDQPGE